MTEQRALDEQRDILRRRARRLLGPCVPAAINMRELVALCLGATDGREDQRSSLLKLALESIDLEDRCRHEDGRRLDELFDAIEKRLALLRRIPSSSDLLDRICRDIVEVCGFTRAMISRVDGEHWLPWMVHFAADPSFEHEFVTWIRGTRIPLSDAPPEREAVTQGLPVIVRDSSVDTYRPIVMAGRTASYLVVPLIPAGRVVGCLHVDHFPDPREVDRVDRDALWAFAEGFGRIYERAVLSERLRAQGDRVRAALDVADVIAENYRTAGIAFAVDPSANTMPQLTGHPTSPLEHSVLTDRERDVMTHLVRGLSNRAIADALAIQEGTVKSHVKQILRKVGAANRTQAISRYLDPSSGGT